ncbi:MAG: exosome complex RNA-binding protein Csl4 [Nitrososphaerota archaeon]|nr:exosome complex RNA-binding protein Csl4 [Candidatus Bathyarchaeota archaeon]MDW8061705.1 exosome complex RNA-binding protein Csl4 [Nitrososphaerota archaeon]
MVSGVVRREEIVVPGDRVAVVEEFEPKYGFYEDLGIVRSSMVGYPVFDMDKRIVYIEKTLCRYPLPKPGDNVYCLVYEVSDRIAFAHILKVVGRSKVFQPPFTGILHISRLKKIKADNMRDIVKPGDNIYASIVSYCNNVYHLTISGPGFGVILARCPYCGSILERKEQSLVCVRCNVTEQRRISKYYGNFKVV